jgi:hypothetical protein
MTTLSSLIFGTIMTNGSITGGAFIASTLCSLAIGIFIAFMYTIKNSYSKSYIVTLALLPAVVQVVIMLVNGNIGAGIAVAGAFSLVRFRSAPGSGKEITSIFLAMAVGLATGMGYIGVALLFTIVVSVINIILNITNLGADGNGIKTLRIMVPENLDYEGKFDEIFNRYLKSYTYDEVKTTNMGSLYKLTLSVALKPNVSEKEFLDELRAGNGNLDISLGRMVDSMDSL